MTPLGLADTADRFEHVFAIYWPIGAAVGLIVVAALIGVGLRFRSNAREFPGGRHASPLGEGLYALTVAAIVAVLLVVTFTTMDDEREASATAAPSGAVKIDVRAAQWSWRFTYAGGKVVRGDAQHNPTLVVPAGRPVHFAITSADVVHAFWIDEREFKVDAFPERTTHATLIWPDPGFWRQGGRCNQYCGLDHTDMNFDVRALAPEEFEAWLAR
jgi:cytochrome c oxidase subunit 2